MPWNPEQYNRFKAERFAPFDDLMGLVRLRPGLEVIDLGCGTGELTLRLAEALPGSVVTGIDASRDMLRETRHFTHERLSFRQQTIEEALVEKKQYDLVFSNAALQWVSGHRELMPRLRALLKPGGQLAVQVPSNHTHFTHRLIRELAGSPPFAAALGGWQRESPVLDIETCAQLLYGLGGTEITVFEKVYAHVLPDAEALAEWTSGTALIPYLERMPKNMHAAFMERYVAALQEQFPNKPVFYPFKRTLFSAVFG